MSQPGRANDIDDLEGYELGIREKSDEWVAVERGESPDSIVISPRSFVARYVETGLPPITMEVEVSDSGTPACRQLTVERSERSITTGMMRELPFHRILRAVARSACESARRGSDGRVRLYEASTKERKRFLANEPQRATRLVTPELLDDVARIYRANPEAPARAVHEQLRPQVSRATAGRYIAEARRRGKLGRATPRRAGEQR